MGTRATSIERARALAARGAVGRVLRRLARRPGVSDPTRTSPLHQLERRIEGLEAEQLPELVDDLVDAVEQLRQRVEAAEVVAEASRAVPYASGGVLRTFRDPHAGLVLGFRGAGGAAAYREFEDVFRGPEERVAERQRVYLDLLAGQAPVLDVGCGRGELLDLLREGDIDARGVDADAGMVARTRDKGHEVTLADANEHLAGLEPESLGAVFCAQFVEHLPYVELHRFLELAHRALRAGGVLIAETVNPHAPQALKVFWVDPTHQHPLFPETLLLLCRVAGFGSGFAFHPLGSGHVEEDRHREGEYAVVAER
ncbi:MAG: class I SAM-dependent methyltransferase [Thermoleophilaceae bacterium]